MLPTGGLRTSASRLAPYENCPLQFFYGSLVEIGGTRTTSMRLGGAFHDVLEAFHDPERKRAADARAAARARAASSRSRRSSRARWQREQRRMLEQLLENYFASRSRPVSMPRCSRSSSASASSSTRRR